MGTGIVEFVMNGMFDEATTAENVILMHAMRGMRDWKIIAGRIINDYRYANGFPLPGAKPQMSGNEVIGWTTVGKELLQKGPEEQMKLRIAYLEHMVLPPMALAIFEQLMRAPMLYDDNGAPVEPNLGVLQEMTGDDSAIVASLRRGVGPGMLAMLIDMRLKCVKDGLIRPEKLQVSVTPKLEDDAAAIYGWKVPV